jgi:hypothetical protein
MQACDTNGMSMDHRQAQSTKAAERYFLDQMNEPERFDFENHYFECQECAGDVRAVEALVKGFRAVCAEEPVPVRVHTPSSVPAARPAPRGWWSNWLTPAFAAALAVVTGYQGMVVIPALKSQTGSRALVPIVLRAAARGDEQTVEILRDQPISLLSIDVNNVDPETPLTYEMTGPGGVRISNTTKAPPVGSPLIVLLANTDFSAPGSWMLVLRGTKGNEITRYPFSVQIK